LNRITLAQRFFALPVEVQLQIVNLTTLQDILNLRKTNTQFRCLTIVHESYLVNTYLRSCVPSFVVRLFPPEKKSPTLQYVTELAVRQSIASDLAKNLAEQVLKEMMGRRHRRNMDRETRERMLRRLQRGMAPLVLSLLQFFENYVVARLQRVGTNPSHDYQLSVLGLLSRENMLIQSDIIAQYPENMLLPIHQMYHLLLHLFFRRFTPPSLPIVGTLGRRKSRPPSSDAFAKVFVYGGIKELYRLYCMKGYGRRRRALDKYVDTFDEEQGKWKARIRQFGANIASMSSSPPPPQPATVQAAMTTAAGAQPSSSTASNSSITGSEIKRSVTELAQVHVDELSNLWTPAAEERLLSKNIIRDLEEVVCCGQFVSLLLTTPEDEDEEEDEEDDEDDEDEEEEEYDYEEVEEEDDEEEEEEEDDEEEEEEDEDEDEEEDDEDEYYQDTIPTIATTMLTQAETDYEPPSWDDELL
jgi:hypothetical protein